MSVSQLMPATRQKLRGVIDEYLLYDRLQDYSPYPKQFRFHTTGRTFANRLLRAGNQVGKSWSGAAETAMHLTGEYPDWWPGHRFERPIQALVAGVSGDAVRDVAQRLLIGEVGREGTGLIPRRCLTAFSQRAKGVGNLLDFIRIRHTSGGTSHLRFRFYTQDRKTWQGYTLDWLWMDEEPPEDLYQEAMARLTATKGRSILTFTPLLGYTEVVSRYIDPHKRGPTRTEVVMTLHDAQHLTAAEVADKIAEYPEHERPARINGEPAAGEGAVYPISDERITCESFEVPEWWPRIGGIDFGWSDLHPCAAVYLAIDPLNDVLYVVKEHRASRRTPTEHWLTLMHWGWSLPWAWPKDGGQQRAGDGVQQAELFRAERMNLLHEHAQYAATLPAPGMRSQSTISLERGVLDILQRMKSDRFKVFDSCEQWLDEKRRYHRSDGKVVKIFDDLMDATRYAVMMVRYAEPIATRGSPSVRPAPLWQAM